MVDTSSMYTLHSTETGAVVKLDGNPVASREVNTEGQTTYSPCEETYQLASAFAYYDDRRTA